MMTKQQESNSYDEKNIKDNHSPGDDDAVLPLMQLASAHVASQALRSCVQLNMADMISDAATRPTSLTEIAQQIGPTTNQDALLRTLRLLESVGIVQGHRPPQYQTTTQAQGRRGATHW
jgi:predicted transcriptional regulator